MKNVSRFTIVLIVSNLLTICILIWCCCCNCHRLCNKWHHSDSTKSGEGPTTCCPGNCYFANCENFPLINVGLASKLVHNYRENHWRTINRNLPPFNIDPAIGEDTTVDSRSCWFSLESLKSFIYTIEKNSCLPESCGKKLELGIRFYYGEYPVDTNELKEYSTSENEPINILYSGMHTLLLVPTFYDEDRRIDIDFDPLVFKKELCNGSSIFDTVTSVTSMLAAAPNINSRNHGGLMPPPFKYGIYWSQKGSAFTKYVDVIRDQYTTTPPPVR